jgi:predicted  nucleic acid-binding Zn-ribbon protein
VEWLTSGTVVGPGSFRCRRCGYVLTLADPKALDECPACAGRDFARASLFSTERIPAEREGGRAGGTPSQPILSAPSAIERDARLAKFRARITQSGQYLCYEQDGELRTVALTREWTRIGRSLAADVRFDDPTVSRRHALLVRHPDGVRVLDDRSLNGVFVNGARVEGSVLSDGDEIIVGRHRLSFLSVTGPPEEATETRPRSALPGTS